MTLAILEATLLTYLDESRALREVPVLRLLSRPLPDIKEDAETLRKAILEGGDGAVEVEFAPGESEAGGGAIGRPAVATVLLALSSAAVRPAQIARHLRSHDPPVVVRLQNDRVLIDPRTLFPADIPVVARAVLRAVRGGDR